MIPLGTIDPEAESGVESAVEVRPLRHPADDLDPALAALLRPADWNNARPVDRYDLLVVGGGAVAVAAAECAAGTGARVALATDEPLALDVLCDAVPRAAFLRAANQVCQVRRAAAAVWPDAQPGRLDFAALRRQLGVDQQQMAARFAAHSLAARGIDLHFGPLTFAGPACLKVAGHVLEFSRAVVAPSLRTAVPAIEGLEGLGQQTPESLAMLTALPRRWAILGSGSVACELAQAFRRLGSAVDLISPDVRLLAGHESLVGDIIARQFTADGIQLHLGWTCRRVQRTGSVKSLVIEQGEQRQKVLADEILVAGDRRTELDWLRLQAANIDAGPDGIAVDRHLRTSNRRVFALGPRAAGDVLQHESVEAVARLAVANALGWRQQSASDLPAPRWLRTDPPVCWLRQDTPQVADIETIESHAFPLPPEGPSGSGLTMLGGLPVASAGGLDESLVSGWLILRFDRRRRRVVGATIVGSAARELLVPLSAAVSPHCGLAAFLAGLLPTAVAKSLLPALLCEPDWLRRLIDEQWPPAGKK